ncbi:MAG: hypothetical protein CSB06_01000 [Bacteroidia bacterium]|nr:MAG: hypothetical protein CSB06_01000 [Bacteroidia bacterium]
MNTFLRLIRFKSLIIIAFTQYTMRYAVIFPMLKAKGYVSQFSDLHFFLLVLSTILLAASGYAINNYFDTRFDLINKPEEVISGRLFNRRHVMNIHLILSILGVLVGFYVSWQIHLWKLLYIYILIAGLLWFYSSTYKGMFLIGNLIVAILTAIIPLMPVLYEIPPLNETYGEVLLSLKDNFNDIFFWVCGFSAFVFLSTFNREVIKDAEDFEGDRAYGSRSLPVVAGLSFTKIFTAVLSALTAGLVLLTYFLYIANSAAGGTLALVYIVVTLVLPSLYLSVRLLRIESKKGWSLASKFSQIIILSGICFAFIIYYKYL